MPVKPASCTRRRTRISHRHGKVDRKQGRQAAAAGHALANPSQSTSALVGVADLFKLIATSACMRARAKSPRPRARPRLHLPGTEMAADAERRRRARALLVLDATNPGRSLAVGRCKVALETFRSDLRRRRRTEGGAHAPRRRRRARLQQRAPPGYLRTAPGSAWRWRPAPTPPASGSSLRELAHLVPPRRQRQEEQGR